MANVEDTPPPKSRPAGERGTYRHGFIFGGFSFFGASVIGLVSTVITSRLYGIHIVGQFALVAAPVAALWVLSSVKEQQALIKEITGLAPRSPRVTQLFAVVFTFSWALTAVVGLLEAVVCWFVFRGPLDAPELVAPTFVSIAGYVVVTNTCWNLDSIFSAFVAGRQLFWVNLHQGVSFVVLAAALNVVWHSVWGLVVATIGGWATSLVHRLISVRPFVRARLSWGEFRKGVEVLPELLRFGLKATPGQIAQGVSQQSGIWALGMLAPVATVGAYSRALTIPVSLQAASMRITTVLYPTLVGRHKRGDGHGFDRAMIDSIRYEVIGLLLIAAAIGGAAHSVLDIFGPGFSKATPALALLILFPVLASVTVTQTQALWAINRPGRTSTIAMVRVMVTIILLVALTPNVGIVGPAIALLAGYLAVIVLSGGALRPALARPLRATWPLRERFALVGAYVAGFAAAHATEHAIPAMGGLPFCLLAGTMAYVAMFLVCGGLNSRDRSRLTELVDWTRSRVKQRGDHRPSQPGSTQAIKDVEDQAHKSAMARAID
jgi:O-antigen/teichoic acid export membrane protein